MITKAIIIAQLRQLFTTTITTTITTTSTTCSTTLTITASIYANTTLYATLAIPLKQVLVPIRLIVPPPSSPLLLLLPIETELVIEFIFCSPTQVDS